VQVAEKFPYRVLVYLTWSDHEGIGWHVLGWDIDAKAGVRSYYLFFWERCVAFGLNEATFCWVLSGSLALLFNKGLNFLIFELCCVLQVGWNFLSSVERSGWDTSKHAWQWSILKQHWTAWSVILFAKLHVIVSFTSWLVVFMFIFDWFLRFVLWNMVRCSWSCQSVCKILLTFSEL